MQASGPQPIGGTLGTLTRLARAVMIQNPPGLSGDMQRFAALRSIKAFARPMDAAIRRSGEAAPWSGDELNAICTSANGSLSVLLVSEPDERVEQALVCLSAAMFQRQALRAVTKDQRQRFRAALGDIGWLIATQEAPVLYPRLVLAETALSADEEAALLSGDTPLRGKLLSHAALRFVGVAGACCLRLEPLVRRRLDHWIENDTRPPMQAVPDMPQLVKLMRRRIPAWSTIIG